MACGCSLWAHSRIDRPYCVRTTTARYCHSPHNTFRPSVEAAGSHARDCSCVRRSRSFHSPPIKGGKMRPSSSQHLSTADKLCSALRILTQMHSCMLFVASGKIAERINAVGDSNGGIRSYRKYQFSNYSRRRLCLLIWGISPSFTPVISTIHLR